MIYHVATAVVLDAGLLSDSLVDNRIIATDNN
jgi:hypothetical protein